MSRRGLTFAEVLVGIGILAMAVLGLVSVQIYSLQAGNAGRTRHQASVLGRDRMDALEALLRTSREEFGRDHNQPRTPCPEDSRYSCAVAERSASATLKQITVALYFNDHGDHEYSLTTLVHRQP